MANSAEAIVYGATKALVDGRCYPDVAPQNTPRPYVTYQDVGGQSPNYLSNTVELENARMQVNVWADSRAAARALMRSVIKALTADPIGAATIGGPVSVYESDTKLYGSREDFSIWFTP
ncbi:DUF3168 domain-containing protein [Paraburkholderia silviterrae]|uniref:DUF3168 domain-containing protein n=1 Tax=Paraburkholderia silviterrae TaxID=2528715 RepID=A0A4R5ME17_9BURK|nr:DUF3168 domain-containing protein [Paraburkholderia silviterrae]TDG25360.1 DUF3168 domain-containing protein [Paraburkholderia silviterrae]